MKNSFLGIRTIQWRRESSEKMSQSITCRASVLPASSETLPASKDHGKRWACPKISKDLLGDANEEVLTVFSCYQLGFFSPHNVPRFPSLHCHYSTMTIVLQKEGKVTGPLSQFQALAASLLHRQWWLQPAPRVPPSMSFSYYALRHGKCIFDLCMCQSSGWCRKWDCWTIMILHSDLECTTAKPLLQMNKNVICQLCLHS